MVTNKKVHLYNSNECFSECFWGLNIIWSKIPWWTMIPRVTKRVCAYHVKLSPRWSRIYGPQKLSACTLKEQRRAFWRWTCCISGLLHVFSNSTRATRVKVTIFPANYRKPQQSARKCTGVTCSCLDFNTFNISNTFYHSISLWNWNNTLVYFPPKYTNLIKTDEKIPSPVSIKH